MLATVNIPQKEVQIKQMQLVPHYGKQSNFQHVYKLTLLHKAWKLGMDFGNYTRNKSTALDALHPFFFPASSKVTAT